MTVVDPIRDERGWALQRRPARPRPGQRLAVPVRGLRRAPTRTSTGRVTVPVLWDTQTRADRQQRVGRRSSAMLNDAFDDVRAPRRRSTSTRRARATRSTRSTSASTRRVNNGVYRAGFATVAGGLRGGRVARSSRRSTSSTSGSRPRRYLFGDAHDARPTGACSRRCVRFDAVYHGHFKCNLRRIVDYPNLLAATCATSTSGRASPRRSTSTTSSATTTARTRASTRRGIVPRGPDPRPRTRRTAAASLAVRGDLHRPRPHRPRRSSTAS